MSYVKVEREVGGKKLVLETGKWAKQSAGAVLARWGETVVLAAAADQPLKEGMDFFPLTVDYRERGYAAGMIFGGRFQKREGRPSDKETLTMRLCDRPIRPLWPEGYSRDILIQATALSAEPDVDPDVVAMIACSASLSVSRLPFRGPTGAVRVGMVDGKFVINPTAEQLKTSPLELVVSGTKDAVQMVEAGANEAAEETMVQALEFAHVAIREIAALVEELAAKYGPVKEPYAPPPPPAILLMVMERHGEEFKQAAWTAGKMARANARKALTEKLVAAYAAKEGEAPGNKPSEAEVEAACELAWEKVIRRQIADNRRCDGRSCTEVRPISSEVGVLPRTHGSALFTRGETQALVTLTLGTPGDEQTIESLKGEYQDRFLLHYNFPSYCVGEVKMPRGPSRRDIGHGCLARRGLKPVLPEYEQFPYTIRLVSEVLESNGSSSMASVCGGTLALLDAGVPIRAPVAGVAMGLVEEEGRFHVVTDILGDEDHYGDMDFKVAGTAQGITALQMDLKRHGVPFEVMRRALEQARAARLHVLAEMAKTLSAPRTNIAEHAPKIIQLKVPVDKIGKLIGPGGKMIRGLEEKYGVTIDVADDGSVVVASPKRDQAGQCVVEIEGLTGTPEVGKVYLGEVVNIREFGVFLEILPGTDGMCHVSELDTAYVKDPTEFCKVGDKLEVKLISIDDMGRLKLSRKALLLERSGQAPAAPGDGQAAQAQPAGAPVGVERRTPGGMSGEERKKWLDREQAGGRERGGRGGGRRGGGGGGRGGGRGGPPRNGG